MSGYGDDTTAILVLEDHKVVRKALVEIVQQVYGAAVVTETELCAQALQAVQRDTFDVAIVDLGLPDGNGIDVIRALRQASPAAEIIVATIFDDNTNLFDAMRAGATGYLLKESLKEELIAGLEGLRDGRPALSPSVMRRLISSMHESPDSSATPLTPREQEVLKLIAKGLNRTDVAELLGLSKFTVSDYIKTIYRKLDVSSRAEATLEAEKLGLIRGGR